MVKVFLAGRHWLVQGTGWSASQLLSFGDSIETMKNKRKSAGGL